MANLFEKIRAKQLGLATPSLPRKSAEVKDSPSAKILSQQENNIGKQEEDGSTEITYDNCCSSESLSEDLPEKDDDSDLVDQQFSDNRDDIDLNSDDDDLGSFDSDDDLLDEDERANGRLDGGENSGHSDNDSENGSIKNDAADDNDDDGDDDDNEMLAPDEKGEEVEDWMQDIVYDNVIVTSEIEAIQRADTAASSFKIPKTKKHERELLEELDMGGHEMQKEVRPVVETHFKNSSSAHVIHFTAARRIHNPRLLNQFTEYKKELRRMKYTDKELAPHYAFLYVTTEHAVRKIAAEGLSCSSVKTFTSCLGNPTMGVYLSRHSDTVFWIRPNPSIGGYLIVFRIFKGKVKAVVENHQVAVEPTPTCNMHVSKAYGTQAFDLTHNLRGTNLQAVFASSQYYIYEYDHEECETVARPRQILPYAVLTLDLTPDPPSNTVPRPLPSPSPTAHLNHSPHGGGHPPTGGEHARTQTTHSHPAPSHRGRTPTAPQHSTPSHRGGHSTPSHRMSSATSHTHPSPSLAGRMGASPAHPTPSHRGGHSTPSRKMSTATSHTHPSASLAGSIGAATSHPTPPHAGARGVAHTHPTPSHTVTNARTRATPSLSPHPNSHTLPGLTDHNTPSYYAAFCPSPEHTGTPYSPSQEETTGPAEAAPSPSTPSTPSPFDGAVEEILSTLPPLPAENHAPPREYDTDEQWTHCPKRPRPS